MSGQSILTTTTHPSLDNLARSRRCRCRIYLTVARRLPPDIDCLPMSPKFFKELVVVRDHCSGSGGTRALVATGCHLPWPSCSCRGQRRSFTGAVCRLGEVSDIDAAKDVDLVSALLAFLIPLSKWVIELYPQRQYEEGYKSNNGNGDFNGNGNGG